jgi:AbrB family looped-hinge helix DNA binding protein
MREIWASVTERGQVTIPAEVRRALGLKKRDKVVFALDDGVVVLKKPRFTIETAAMSIPALNPPLKDVDAAIREAKEEKVAREIEKMRRGEA